MARRRGRRRGGKKSKAIPLAIVAPVAMVAWKDMGPGATGGVQGKLNRFMEDITGYNIETGRYDVNQALPLWTGALMGIVVHKIASKTGVNAKLKKLTFGYLVL